MFARVDGVMGQAGLFTRSEAISNTFYILLFYIKSSTGNKSV